MTTLNSPKLHFHIATPEDALQIQQLVESAFRANDTRQDWTGNVELASHFRLPIDEVATKIASPEIVVLMALDSNNADSLVASIEVSKRNGSGRLSMIAVHERCQQGGVGRQVLAYAEDYCRENWGVAKFSLNALSTRKALIEWYERRGYVRTGETCSFPRERFRGLALPEDMCFVELEKHFSDAQ